MLWIGAAWGFTTRLQTISWLVSPYLSRYFFLYFCLFSCFTFFFVLSSLSLNETTNMYKRIMEIAVHPRLLCCSLKTGTKNVKHILNLSVAHLVVLFFLLLLPLFLYIFFCICIYCSSRRLFFSAWTFHQSLPYLYGVLFNF